MKKILLFILVGFSLSIPTKAYSMSGQKFLKMCEEKKFPHKEYNNLSTHACKFYFKGMRDMELLLTFFPSYMDKEKKGDLSRLVKFQDSCMPDKVNIEQLYLIMIDWLKNNPEKIHLEMIYLYWEAMREAFPCD